MDHVQRVMPGLLAQDLAEADAQALCSYALALEDQGKLNIRCIALSHGLFEVLSHTLLLES